MLYKDSEQKYYELQSLEGQHELLKPQLSLARSVNIEMNANVAANACQSREEDNSGNHGEWESEGAAVLDEVERARDRRPFRDFQ